MTSFHSPDEMLAEVLDTTGTITGQIRTIVSQITAIRPQLRELFTARIHAIPTGPTVEVTAIDGASTMDQLAVGDHCAVLAVSVAQNENGEVGLTGHQSWGGLLSHSSDQDTLVKGIMLSTEASLVPEAGNGVIILDGSRTTALHAIHAGLSSHVEEVARLIYRYCKMRDVGPAFQAIAAGDRVVGSAKSNSSRELWKTATGRGLVTGFGVPDKVICSLILNPGEMLLTEPATDSERTWLTGQGIEHPEYREYFATLASGFASTRTSWVAHAKPYDSMSVFRIEISGEQSPEAVTELIRAVCQNGTPPYIQEPVTQYIADIIAKRVSIVSKVQMERSQLEAAAQGDGVLEHLIRSYRTN